MKVPNAHLAIVEQGKIVEYLLNSDHSENGGKAAFFRALGFSSANWRELAAAPRKLVDTGEVSNKLESVHGHK